MPNVLLLEANAVRDVLAMAVECTNNGKSEVRKHWNRVSTCPTDQVMGQLGELALYRLIYGKQGEDLYHDRRVAKNQKRYEGDRGDLIINGSVYDAKTSLMRHGSDPNKYNLIVPPREHRDDWTYVLFLVPGMPNDNAPCKVLVAGWAKGNELKKENFKGHFGPKHVRPVPMLNPWSELRSAITAARRQSK